jgi:large subunit ribosomal protein L29
VKAEELRSMSAEQLGVKLADLKKELFNLRFQHAINQLDNPHKISDVKHDIARVMTVLREKNA